MNEVLILIQQTKGVDDYGDPVMDEDMFVLDPTHPDGEAFLRETFSYLAGCGFTFYICFYIVGI